VVLCTLVKLLRNSRPSISEIMSKHEHTATIQHVSIAWLSIMHKQWRTQEFSSGGGGGGLKK
jgi:hypothetical protein